jgi:hypothetical protein
MEVSSGDVLGTITGSALDPDMTVWVGCLEVNLKVKAPKYKCTRGKRSMYLSQRYHNWLDY